MLVYQRVVVCMIWGELLLGLGPVIGGPWCPQEHSSASPAFQAVLSEMGEETRMTVQVVMSGW